MAQEQIISRKEWEKKCKDYLEEDKKHVGEISSPDYYHKTPYGHPLVRSLVTEELIRHYARGAMATQILYILILLMADIPDGVR